jgi:transposase InsO family protein
LFILHDVPGHIRSDKGSEFIAREVQAWITAVRAQMAYIAPGSPSDNGYRHIFVHLAMPHSSNSIMHIMHPKRQI